ncbi:hypothetical protein EI94DRAFT_1745077 [Lactarius quietus]|nr:hypothetical protein EI94DRAFT_1745077 [Lactarius quietus]
MKNDATEAALGLLNLNDAATTSYSSTVPSKRAAPQDDEQPHASTTSDSINCICGYTFDDGFSIACDDCSRWCHAACFEIVQGGVPEEWKCWVCAPRPVDRERAVRLQTQRKQDAIRADNEKRRRQTSPCVERRRRSALAIDGGGGGNSRRRRRPSVNLQPVGEDEHVNVDEPWTQSYIPIFKDIVPHQETRDKLRRQAKHWRGVSALSHSPFPPTPLDNTPVLLSAPPSAPPTSIRPLPHSSFSHPLLSSHTNPSVRPPSYSMHTIQPISSSKLITPYTSTIIPSSAYLSDPLNAYAHHGMPKPFVHLFGPPLDVALDARITGNEARFVRSGCRPNAVLRPMLCPRTKATTEELDPSSSKCRDSEMLTFGVFALRDIKANEEVVLGWEWDDGNAVHHLPALIEAPHMFPAHHLSHIRNQMASMLHALSSTFTTCACGSKAKDCALNLMAEFVDGRLPVPASPLSQRPNDPDMGSSHHRLDLGPLVGAQRGFHTREKSPLNGGMNGVEMIPDQSAGPSDRRASVDVTPHPQKENGVQPDHLASTSASPIQVEVDRSQEVREPLTPDLSPSHPRRHFPDPAGHSTYRSSSPSDSDPQPQSEDEEQMPPKMRKRWIHRSMEGLSAVSPSLSPCGSNISLGSVLDEGQMEVDLDTKDMPPPPMPANLDPTTVSSIAPSSSPRVFTGKLSSLPLLSGADPPASPSPSTPFANLSLLSPTASYSSNNSSPLSPKLSTLTSSFLSITSAFAPIHDADAPAIQMDENEDDLRADSDPTPRRRTRSPSPQSLLSPSSEPLRRLPSPTPPPPPLARAPSPSPSSPPPHPPLSPQVTPKVKMSLKDFAMRKKKQREEELARTAVGPADSDEAHDLNGIGPTQTRSDCEPTSSSTSATNGNGILRRVSRSRTASPPPSPSEDSEDSEAGGASMPRSAPPTHPRSFSLSSSSSSSTTTVASTSAAPGPHRLPPSSTYRPGSSYVPPSIPPSVRPLPSGPRALRAGMGIGVGVGAGAGGLQAAAPFTSPVRGGFPQAQFVGVPRGPSADRDRDRGWASTGRGRGRGTTSSSSWGR